MDSVQLRQQRARLVEQMRELHEGAEGENRALSAEEQQKFDRMKDEASELGTRISRAEEIEQMAVENGNPVGGDPADPEARNQPGGEGAERRTAYLAAVRHGLRNIEPEQRQLVEDATGEILVPEDVETELFREIGALTVMRDLVSTRTTQSNRIRKRSLTEVAVGWGKLETGTVLTESTLVPSEEFFYIEDLYGLTKVGEDELDDTDVNLEATIRDSFARAIAEAEDTAVMVGAGHSPDEEPTGVLVDPDVAAVTAGQAGAITVDDALQLVYEVPPQYRRRAAFVMASGTELAFALLRDESGGAGTGAYLWQPSIQAGRPNTFLGFPVYNQEDTSAIPAAGYSDDVAVFGDWEAGYRLWNRQGVTMKRIEELYHEDGLVGFRAKFRVGGGVIRPNALRKLTVPA